MRDGVHTVGGDGHLEEVVVLHVEVLLGGHADGCVVGQDHDAGVVGAELQLVGSAEHALADGAAQLALLDFVVFGVGGVDLGAYLCADHLLTGSDIGGAADDVEGRAGADVDGGEVQVVAVGVGLAGEHLGDNHVLQAATDGLHLLDAVDFEAAESQQVVELGGRHRAQIHVLLKPIE